MDKNSGIKGINSNQPADSFTMKVKYKEYGISFEACADEADCKISYH